jgi:trimeric autotransporter adhesin
MKMKTIRFSGYCLVIGLITLLTMAVSACSSGSSTTNIVTSSSNSSTTTEINATTTKTTTSSVKTTTSGKVTATLTSIAISPTNPPSLKLGFTQNFIATGTYSDGSTADVSPLVTWHSSDSTIAAFTQPSGGLLQAMALGTATITASYQGMTANSVNITVIPMPF